MNTLAEFSIDIRDTAREISRVEDNIEAAIEAAHNAAEYSPWTEKKRAHITVGLVNLSEQETAYECWKDTEWQINTDQVLKLEQMADIYEQIAYWIFVNRMIVVLKDFYQPKPKGEKMATHKLDIKQAIEKEYRAWMEMEEAKFRYKEARKTRLAIQRKQIHEEESLRKALRKRYDAITSKSA